jgi:hypothetical protein
MELHFAGVGDRAIAERLQVSRSYVVGIVTAERKEAGLPALDTPHD